MSDELGIMPAFQAAQDSRANRDFLRAKKLSETQKKLAGYIKECVAMGCTSIAIQPDSDGSGYAGEAAIVEPFLRAGYSHNANTHLLSWADADAPKCAEKEDPPDAN